MSETHPPAINQPWPEQGGIYVGARLIDGQVHHIITPAGTDLDQHGNYDQIEGGKIEFGEINGFSDWHAGDQEDVMLAFINAREHFVCTGSDSIYWTRSLHHGYPWAVVFENGHVNYNRRNDEFRVRPFRSVIHSSI